MPWYEYWPMPWMFFGPLMMLVFLVFCGAFMVLVMRGMHARHGRGLDILGERFARGEISRAEYEELRRLLREA
jgi:uncharacterized membrane protein